MVLDGNVRVGYLRALEARRVVHESMPVGPRPPRLLDRVREAIRLRHGRRSTEKSHVRWIRRYILFDEKRNGKGAKDRVTLLPAVAKTALVQHLEKVKHQHEADLRRGAGWVELPGALDRKYPNAGREWPTGRIALRAAQDISYYPSFRGIKS